MISYETMHFILICSLLDHLNTPK